MKHKIYNIIIEQNIIGTTELEKADASMGVVFGKINFIDIKSGYEFFKNYCAKNKIQFTDYPEDKLIMTMNIEKMKVVDKNDVEIKGLGCNVSGMDNDIFEVTILGIPNSFYEIEFQKHLENFNEKNKI